MSLKHPAYKYSLSVDVIEKNSDEKFDKILLRSESEYWINLDEALKPEYKYHFMRDVARNIVSYDNSVINSIVYELYRDSHNEGKAPKAYIINNTFI